MPGRYYMKCKFGRPAGFATDILSYGMLIAITPNGLGFCDCNEHGCGKSFPS